MNIKEIIKNIGKTIITPKGNQLLAGFQIGVLSENDKLISYSVYQLPKYNQIIQPYEYGHPYSKKTCLWLRGLPKLPPTKVITDIYQIKMFGKQ